MTTDQGDNNAKVRRNRRFVAPALVSGALLLGIGRAPADTQPTPATNSVDQATLIAVTPPPFSKGIFPCSECHKPDDKVNRTPRIVAEHDTVVFEHDKKNRWCLDCHDAQDRDKLRLASGVLLDFRESFKLCGQCHGTQLRDWTAGEHGKRTGSWSGQKQYLLCVNCHNPHSPRFRPVKPLPPPQRPELSK
ncbi:MAG: hypothetical protein NTV49_06735 [Kiritimatiellaeota bacterium]|nr:hypothetical protein [Kiritimatiellota bacterium]